MTSVAVKGGGRRRAIGVSLMVLIIVAGLVSARAAAVSIQEERIALEPGEIARVHAQTSWGVPFRDALSWTTQPSTLGLDGRERRLSRRRDQRLRDPHR